MINTTIKGPNHQVRLEINYLMSKYLKVKKIKKVAKGVSGWTKEQEQAQWGWVGAL